MNKIKFMEYINSNEIINNIIDEMYLKNNYSIIKCEHCTKYIKY